MKLPSAVTAGTPRSRRQLLRKAHLLTYPVRTVVKQSAAKIMGASTGKIADVADLRSESYVLGHEN